MFFLFHFILLYGKIPLKKTDRHYIFPLTHPLVAAPQFGNPWC